ncbi:alpha/beta hydrolase [Flavobacterium sp. PLA-1-15]|uniref:alpha/beta hydrolase n=1 Tax=Flavobacterium sp. PLA-1-15 TaxID=3380533 RepID=UPI003B7F9000
MQKIHVYFMPGLAASSLIFERIELPENVFEIHLLDWEMPISREILKEYAKRMASLVTHENAVLVGVSFGGVLVQEMAQFLKLKKVIIISSVKCNLEVPMRMKFAKSTKAYKLLPTGLMKNVDVLAKFSFGTIIKQRLKLYEKYLSMREKVYLDWAIEQMIMWERTEVDTKVIHIHGDMDEVFPIKNIKNCHIIKGGTHIMILSKFRWLNENLPRIILEEEV